MTMKKVPEHIKLDERNHVEKPFLAQLQGLGWEIIDLTDIQHKQKPEQTFRKNFTEVVMLPVLHKQIKIINPWLENEQIDEVVKQLAANFPSTGLIENNQYVLQLLLENTSVSINRKTGEQSPTVKFIDFENKDNNRFIAVCQFKIRILGTEHHIFPDITLFVNGLPLVVIECKSPKVKDAIPEAIDQILRYSEQRGEKGEGSAPLFYFNQFTVVTCRQEAKFGTITTHKEKYFYSWSDPYPRNLNDLEHGVSSPNNQQRLVAGMMDKTNLLDLLRNFTIFTTNENGQTIKIVGRYQQFRAVKLGIKKLLEGKSPRERSGIIWHTQGSGKSLTMMFMVREMYRHNRLANWKIIFVTDRTHLEDQLTETSKNIGLSVNVANSIRELKELIRADTSNLVMAMIHKFREADLTETFPLLNNNPNILIMIDEAHRSQYKMLGANLDKGIPNAARFGYTGTPIDKTERVFGDYIDRYSMRQAIEDGVTLEVVYEGRTQNAEVKDQEAMDNTFQDIFSDYNLQERLQILSYSSRNAYLEAEPTIRDKARDMVEHYLTHVFPNGYKAQVVATSREAAVRYKKHIDAAFAEKVTQLQETNPCGIDIKRLLKLNTDVIISPSTNDLPYLKQYTNKSKHGHSIKSFKLKFDSQDQEISGDVGILIVNSMLLTGFNAPIEQVMYLDKIITDHNLLQATARVNRVDDDSKEKGFVVDYIGIGHHLKKALNAYDEREQKEITDCLSFPEEELRNLESSHADIMALLKKYKLNDLNDHDAFFDIFYDEDIRFEYMQAFNKLTQCMNLVFPSKEALNFMSDYNALTEINVLAGKHFRDERLSMKGIPPKLRAISDQYLVSRGIEQRIEPISIFDDNFEKDVSRRSRTKTKAAEIEHAIRHHIDVDLDDDPDLQASFSEALERIFEQFRDNWERIYKELQKLREKMRKASKEPTYGLHRKKQMPFFRCFKQEFFSNQSLNEDEISILVALTQRIFIEIERELNLVGFWDSIPARNKLRADIQHILLEPEYSQLPNIIVNREKIISRIMEIAAKKNDIILYAK